MTDEGLCPRALRAAVFAAACVLLSAVTFAVVGRGSAPLWAVLAALAAVYPLAWLGGARVRGLAGIGALTLVVQVGLDYWFSLAQLDQSVLRGCGLIRELPPMGESLSCARTAAPAQAEPVPGGSAMTVGGKPEILYLGAEYCPYCAAQRWPLVLALSRFGTFTGLGLTESTSTDVYPNTNTFTFLHATYTSAYLVFTSVELYDRAGKPLQSPTAAEQQLLQSRGDGLNGRHPASPHP